MHKHKLFFILVIATFLIGGFVMSSRAADFDQGFEVDTSGWSGVGGSSIERVSSNTGGVPSSSGNYHGLLKLGEEVTTGALAGTRPGPKTEWGGFGATITPEGYVTEVDVYLDMSLATGVEEKIFNYSSSVNDTSGVHRRDFVFTGVVVAGEATNTWIVGAGNTVEIDSSSVAVNGIFLDNTGWYTLRHTFKDDGGVLKVVMDLLEHDGTLIWSWTFSDPSDIIGSTVGGSGYGWFVTNDFVDLPVDNVQKIGGDTASPSPVPDPSTEPSVEPSIEPSVEPSVVPSPTISPSPSPTSQGPKSKDDCKKDGWKKFTNPKFKNQGDCVSYVEANENAKGNRKDNWFWSLFSKNDDCDRGVIGRFLSGWYGRDDDCDDRDDRGDRGDKDDKNNNDRKRDSDDDD